MAPVKSSPTSAALPAERSAWGALSLAGALCYAELATSYPHSGGEYHFLRLAFGDRVAFLFAWARLTVIPTGSIALLGFVFGDYATQLLPLAGARSSPLYAATAVAMLTAVNAAGLRSGRRTQNLLTLLQVGGVVAIIAAGLALPLPVASLPMVQATPEATQWGLVLIFVMLAYGGWNEAAYMSAEVVGANRNLPRALVWSIAAITTLYLLMNFAYLRVLGLAGMGESPAVAADMMDRVLGGRGAQLISVAVAVAALTSMNATMLMAARTTYAFGRAAPMFSSLGRWNARLDAPVHAYLVQAAIAMALARRASSPVITGLRSWATQSTKCRISSTYAESKRPALVGGADPWGANSIRSDSRCLPTTTAPLVPSTSVRESKPYTALRLRSTFPTAPSWNRRLITALSMSPASLSSG